MVNWAGVGSGALSGAGTGAAVGGPLGALAGGLLGAGTGLFGGGASNDKLKKVPTGTKAQTQFGGHDLIGLLQQMMGQGGGLNLANQYDQNLLGGNGQDAFNKFSEPYLQQFQEQILPQIAERFAGGGALSSSGFGQALGGASAGLQANLAQLFSQLQGQAAGRQQNQFGNLSQLGLNYQPFQYAQEEGSQGFGGAFSQGVSGNMEGILSGIMSLFKNNGAKSSSSSGGGISATTGTNTSGKYNLPTFLGM